MHLKNKNVTEFCTKVNTEHRFSSSKHPKQMVSWNVDTADVKNNSVQYIGHKQRKDWNFWLNYVGFCLNRAFYEPLRDKSFFIMFSHDATLPIGRIINKRLLYDSAGP